MNENDRMWVVYHDIWSDSDIKEHFITHTLIMPEFSSSDMKTFGCVYIYL